MYEYNRQQLESITQQLKGSFEKVNVPKMFPVIFCKEVAFYLNEHTYTLFDISMSIAVRIDVDFNEEVEDDEVYLVKELAELYAISIIKTTNALHGGRFNIDTAMQVASNMSFKLS